MNRVRRTSCGEYAGMTFTVGGSALGLRGSSGTPTARWFQPASPNPLSERPEQIRAQTCHAEDPGAGVRADHGADLRDQLGFAPVDRAPALGEALGLRQRVDVRDREAVTAVLAALLEGGDEPLERARRGPHALDGLH